MGLDEDWAYRYNDGLLVVPSARLFCNHRVEEQSDHMSHISVACGQDCQLGDVSTRNNDPKLSITHGH